MAHEYRASSTRRCVHWRTTDMNYQKEFNVPLFCSADNPESRSGFSVNHQNKILRIFGFSPNALAWFCRPNFSLVFLGSTGFLPHKLLGTISVHWTTESIWRRYVMYLLYTFDHCSVFGKTWKTVSNLRRFCHINTSNYDSTQLCNRNCHERAPLRWRVPSDVSKCDLRLLKRLADCTR